MFNERDPRLWSSTGRAVMAGGMLGFALVTLLCGLATEGNLSGLVGIIIGAPAGMIVGAIVASVRTKK